MTAGEIAAVLGGCVSLVSLGGIVFAAGVLYNEVKTLRAETVSLQTIVKEWSAVLVRLGMLERFTEKNTSDIRGLLKADSEVREELASFSNERD